MVDQVKLTGLDEVRRALRRLPKEMRRRELNRAIRAGGRPILALAQTLAPIGEANFIRQQRGKTVAHLRGTLQSSIAMRSEKKSRLLDAARIKIGVLWDNRDPNSAWYWRFVEFGTSKMPARPFLVPAFEALKLTALGNIVKELRKGLDRQTRRVAARRRA